MDTLDVLVTCPPMVSMLDELEPALAACNLRATAAPTVQTLSENELLALVPNYDGWIIGDDPATFRVFEAGRQGRLRAAVKWGVGTDNVDFNAAAHFRIPVTNTPGLFAAEVADVAMGYVTGLARETYRIDREVRAGGWPKPRGISLAGKRVGLAGFGNIGRSIAHRLLAAGMQVVAYDPQYRKAEGLESVLPRTWPDGIEQADFVVLACSLTAETVHMVDRHVLARAKSGLRIVNVARGKLVDELALIEALESGHVHSVALDVFEEEPLPVGSKLRRFDRCVFGSHNSSNTVEAVRQASEHAIGILSKFLAAERQ
jgi:D-3-phosphoglycerate dehydrogenase